MVQVTVQYQVVQESIYDAFYRLTNARAQITAYVFDVVRAIVPKSNLDDVFLTKEEVSVYNQQIPVISKNMQSRSHYVRRSLPHVRGHLQSSALSCLSAHIFADT